MTGRLSRSIALVPPYLRTSVPGPRSLAHVEFDHSVTSPSLPRAYPIVPVRGDGLRIEDIDGNVFLDLEAGIAVTSTGHAHPDVVAAIVDQATRLLHFSGGDFYLPLYAQTCAELARISPIKGGTKVLLGNSGAEAVEGAIKLARRATGRAGLVSFLGGFHGRTMGALSLTASKAKYHAGFGPLLSGVYHAPFGHVRDLDWFDEVLFRHLLPPDELAAVIVEPIQGEGGYIVSEPGFLAGLRALTERHGILLIADEIQSGAGRTGRMWAIEHEQVAPDILLTAKGIASGLPLSAVLARADLMDRWQAGHHGSTYGGNPLACAAALATIKLLEGGLIDNAAARGAQFMTALEAIRAKHPDLIREVRGRGLMIGIEFDNPAHADALVWACFVRGLLVLEAGHGVVRISPALTIDEGEVETGARLFGEALDAVAAGEQGRGHH